VVSVERALRSQEKIAIPEAGLAHNPPGSRTTGDPIGRTFTERLSGKTSVVYLTDERFE
jgi:hypothetical protein